MTTLLEWATSAHGGMERWERICRFQAQLSVTGALIAMKGTAAMDNVRTVGETRDQRVMMAPFPDRGHYATWEPHRVTIERTDGRVVLERVAPRSLFEGHQLRTAWEPLHAVHYACAANWNCFAAPFIFARPDFVTQEIEPRKENGELWRRLRVTYPESIVTYCRDQTFSFNDVGLLRRADYSDEFLGGERAVQYWSGYVEYDGIMVATQRTVYIANLGGPSAHADISMAIDVASASFP